MLTLYFSPGACSLASHIGLEETGAPYEAKPILLAKQQQKTEAYLKINPRGKVPSLSVDGKVLVENTAILTYLARRFPEKKLMPADPAEEARSIATMCWSVHGCRSLRAGFLRLGRGRRISHEGAQRLHGMAGAHDAAPDGAESRRVRAERFDIIARYRIRSAQIMGSGPSACLPERVRSQSGDAPAGECAFSDSCRLRARAGRQAGSPLTEPHANSFRGGHDVR